MELAIYPMIDPREDFYLDGKPVNADDMKRWANNWLEDTGRVPTGPAIAFLIQAAFQKVNDTSKVWPPRRHR
jgi:hypothetical protein